MKVADRDPFYRKHVFFCTNRREAGHRRGCCMDRGSGPLRDYMKAKAKEMGLKKVRINSAGCLDRCELGPSVVVYPEGVWYRLENEADIDAVLESHIRDGQVVERLMLDKK